MTQKSFLDQLEHIHCDLSSGITTLGLVQQAALEESNFRDCAESLYVVCTYLQDVRLALLQAIESHYREQAS